MQKKAWLVGSVVVASHNVDIRLMRGFTIESGEIVPVEVTVADITTDCRDVLHDGQSVCWHEKYTDVFRDLCKNCSSHCEVYSARRRPAFGRLVELKRLDSAEAVRFKQRLAANIAELRKGFGAESVTRSEQYTGRFACAERGLEVLEDGCAGWCDPLALDTVIEHRKFPQEQKRCRCRDR